jgi:hypothetical protein
VSGTVAWRAPVTLIWSWTGSFTAGSELLSTAVTLGGAASKVVLANIKASNAKPILKRLE